MTDSSMKKYEAYKNSGIEWIGQIPESWSLSKLKFETDMVLGKMLEDKEPQNNNGSYSLEPYLKSRNIGMLEVFNDIEQLNRMWFNDKEKTLYELKDGDLVMNEGGDIGKVSLWKDPGFKCYIQNSVHKITPHRDVLNSTYLQYLVSIIKAKGYFNTVVSSISIAHLTKEKLAETPILLPPLPEQQVIASYLDHKVSQIDASISAINTQIDDLKSYRQSIISEAVTKGLNPNVPMKDSGVEWIGEIPEGWGIAKLGWVYPNMGSGTTPNSNNFHYYVEEGYNWLQTGDLTDGAITSTSKHLSQIAVDEKRLRFYPIGSIVIAMYGATIGKAGYLEIETSTNQACCVLPPQENMDSRFTFYLMQSSKTTLISKSVGGGQPNISQTIIQEHRIPVPPVSEQQTIASHLDSKTSKIDATIASLESQRDDLNALKQSIISEAVTGKIDVRDWKPNK